MADVRSTLLGVPILDEAARRSIPVVAQYKGVAEAGTLLTFALGLPTNTGERLTTWTVS